MSNLWSGRFAGEPDRQVFAFGASFAFDRRLFEDDVTGSLAWAEALARAGVLSADEASLIREGLEAILAKGLAEPGWVSGPDEDVHAFVERALVERIGTPGRRLHTGRSRNEQVSLDLRLYLKRRLRVVREALVDLVDALVAQAERAGDALMPAYTHLRRAQPVLVAHYWLSHAVAFQRDVGRFARVADACDALPLGSGALAGTAYAVDTTWLAERLGFSRVVDNSLDATADRDFVADFLHAAALTMVHVSRVAEDLIVFGTEEFGFVELDDTVSTGSSLMPQKKNPDPLELVRGKAGRAIGRLSGWLASMKGLPSGYNKDLQEDKEAVFDVEDTLLGSLRSTGTVVATLRVDVERSRRAAGGLMLATDVADFLVARGLPFRAAHELVGRMVRRLLDERRDFADLSTAEWRAWSDRFDETVHAAITPERSVGAKRTPQSTAPEAVASARAAMRAWVREARDA
jgi:argininosuccinate lyase